VLFWLVSPRIFCDRKPFEEVFLPPITVWPRPFKNRSSLPSLVFLFPRGFLFPSSRPNADTPLFGGYHGLASPGCPLSFSSSQRNTFPRASRTIQAGFFLLAAERWIPPFIYDSPGPSLFRSEPLFPCAQSTPSTPRSACAFPGPLPPSRRILRSHCVPSPNL